MVSPASESIRRTFPHSSISAFARCCLINPMPESNRVASALAIAVTKLFVGRTMDLGGNNIQDGSASEGYLLFYRQGRKPVTYIEGEKILLAQEDLRPGEGQELQKHHTIEQFV